MFSYSDPKTRRDSRFEKKDSHEPEKIDWKRKIYMYLDLPDM